MRVRKQACSALLKIRIGLLVRLGNVYEGSEFIIYLENRMKWKPIKRAMDCTKFNIHSMK